MVEVPLEAAEVQSKEAKLRREAGSLDHLMTHLPKNPFCPSCKGAKMQAAPRRRGATSREDEDAPAELVDVVTADHLIKISDEDM